jgi:hypothetical protein
MNECISGCGGSRGLKPLSASTLKYVGTRKEQLGPGFQPSLYCGDA